MKLFTILLSTFKEIKFQYLEISRFTTIFPSARTLPPLPKRKPSTRHLPRDTRHNVRDQERRPQRSRGLCKRAHSPRNKNLFREASRRYSSRPKRRGYLYCFKIFVPRRQKEVPGTVDTSHEGAEGSKMESSGLVYGQTYCFFDI